MRQAAHAGERELIFLDESGFTPTMPTGYTWSRFGQRAVVPREDTLNRRLNVFGAKMLLDFACVQLAGPGGALPCWT